MPRWVSVMEGLTPDEARTVVATGDPDVVYAVAATIAWRLGLEGPWNEDGARTSDEPARGPSDE